MEGTDIFSHHIHREKGKKPLTFCLIHKLDVTHHTSVVKVGSRELRLVLVGLDVLRSKRWKLTKLNTIFCVRLSHFFH